MSLKLRILMSAALLALLGAERMPAPSPFTWIGNGSSGDVNLPANWSGGRPAGDGATTEDVIFGNLNGTQNNPLLPSSGFILHSLTFNDTSRPAYTFSGTGNPTFQLTGDITIATSGGAVTFDSTFNVNLTAGVHNIALTPTGSAMTVASTVIGPGGVTKSGLGTLTLTGTNTFSGGTIVNGGSLQLGNGGSTGSVVSNITDNGTVIFNHSGAVTYSGIISGTGNVTKTGSGIDTLAGVNTYTGVTSINSGTLTVTSLADGGIASNIGASTNVASNLILNNGILNYTGAAQSTDRLFTLGSSGGTINSSGSGALTFTNSGAIAFTGTNTARTLTLTGANGNASAQNVFNAVIGNNGTGATSLVKSGTGAWLLSGANTFTGGVNVNAGDLYISNNAALGGAASVLNLAGATSLHAVGSLTVANSILLGGVATIDIRDGQSDRLTLNGTISGSSQLKLTGDGLLQLYGNNSSWSGALALNGNNLVDIYNTSALGTNATLLFDSSSDSIVNFYVDATIKNLSSLSSPSGLYIENGKTLTINQTSNSTFAGAIQDSGIAGGNLSKTGAGTITLTNSNSYHGSTTINGGAIIADGRSENSNQLGTGATAIGAGGTLTLANTSLSNSSTTVNGRITGSGTIYNSTTLFSGGVLAPGLAAGNRIGALYFDDLTLRGGGILEWNLQDPNGGTSFGPGTAYDLVSITSNSSALRIDYSSVNPSTPFTIKMISLNSSGTPGMTTGFLNQGYTWTVFDGGQSAINFGSGVFNPKSFVLDTNTFTSDAVAGNFALIQNGNLLQITFTPVPEPSTWAMVGAGLVGVVWLRRKRVVSQG